MRPLYVYYKKLKLAIAQRERDGGGGDDKTDKTDKTDKFDKFDKTDKTTGLKETSTRDNKEKDAKMDTKKKDDMKLKLNLNKGYNSNELVNQQAEKVDKQRNSTGNKKSVGGSLVSNASGEYEVNPNSKNPKEQQLNELLKRKAELRGVLQQ